MTPTGGEPAVRGAGPAAPAGAGDRSRLRTPNRMTGGNSGVHVMVGPGREEGTAAAVDRPGRLWARIEPLLPVVPRRADHLGRRRLDDRKVLCGILFVLYTGSPWEFLPQKLGFGSGMTLCLPKISSVQVKRYAGTRGGCRRGGRVCLCGGGWRRPARGWVRAMGVVAGRSRFPDAAGGSCCDTRSHVGSELVEEV